MEIKRYIVSIVWTRNIDSIIRIENTLTSNIVANSGEEAFGIAYERNIAEKRDFVLFTKIVHLIIEL